MITAKQKDTLFKTQKLCIRIVANLRNKDSVQGIFSELKILMLPDMIRLEQAKLGYKVSHNLIPLPIQSIFKREGGEKNIDILHTIKMCLTFKGITVNYLVIALWLEASKNI